MLHSNPVSINSCICSVIICNQTSLVTEKHVVAVFIRTLLDNSVKLDSSIHWESACLFFVEANWILLDCESNYISSNARLEFCCWCIVKLFTASNNLLAYDWFYEGAGSFYYQPITPFFSILHWILFSVLDTMWFSSSLLLSLCVCAFSVCISACRIYGFFCVLVYVSVYFRGGI